MTTDNLAIPQNNLLDGRDYEQHLAFLYPDDLREGDIITAGAGTYQVTRVSLYDVGATSTWQVRHIQLSHTLAGPVMGGLLRGQFEHVQVLARRRDA